MRAYAGEQSTTVARFIRAAIPPRHKGVRKFLFRSNTSHIAVPYYRRTDNLRSTVTKIETRLSDSLYVLRLSATLPSRASEAAIGEARLRFTAVRVLPTTVWNGPSRATSSNFVQLRAEEYQFRDGIVTGSFTTPGKSAKIAAEVRLVKG